MDLARDGWLYGGRFVQESRSKSLTLKCRLDIPHSKLREIYRLIPLSGSVPEKQIIAEIIMKFRMFYGTRRFIPLF